MRILILALVFFTTYSSAVEQVSSEMSLGIHTDSEVTELSEMWGLKASDINKYHKIMRGQRGVFSPNIAPTLALALEAKTQEERIKYTTLYVKQEYQRVKKELEVARLYKQISNNLYPEDLINKGVLLANENEHVRFNDRFVIFTKNECQNCKIKIQQDLLKTARFPNNQTDIYVDGISNNNELSLWARNSGVKVEDVNFGKVTLNLIEETTKSLLNDNDYLIFILRDDVLYKFNN